MNEVAAKPASLARRFTATFPAGRLCSTRCAELAVNDAALHGWRQRGSTRSQSRKGSPAPSGHSSDVGDYFVVLARERVKPDTEQFDSAPGRRR
jgi:hypothetical protein